MTERRADRAILYDRILEQCLALRTGEHFALIADSANGHDALALYEFAERHTSERTLVLAGANEHKLVAAAQVALAEADVFVGLINGSISHTEPRRQANARGARGVQLGNLTSLERLLPIDIAQVAKRARETADALSNANQIAVTCPRGTNLALDVSHCTAIADDGDFTLAGSYGNIPFGEAYLPCGGGGIAYPKTIAGLGFVGADTKLTLDGGRLLAASGTDGARLLALLDAHGAAGRHLAELGLGVSHQARFCGDITEDEKILGTVHIAFGADASFGGDVAVGVHIDCVIANASLTIDGHRFGELSPNCPANSLGQNARTYGSRPHAMVRRRRLFESVRGRLWRSSHHMKDASVP